MLKPHEMLGRILVGRGLSLPGVSWWPQRGTLGRRAMSSLSVRFSADDIQTRVDTLAHEIEAAYPVGHDIHLVGVLRGAFLFLTDLTRCLTRPITLDFARLSSYGSDTVSSGTIAWHLTPDDVAGRHVLIVEDIVDSGRTLETLHQHLLTQKPESLRTVCLIDKPSRRRRKVLVDFIGFTVEDVFLVGYGLDLAGRYRDLPYIAEYRP